MTKTAYFDMNVFDHIHKRIGVTESDLTRLRSLIRAGKLSVLLSILNLEETVPLLNSSPELAIAELKLILCLTDWQKLLKPPNLLLSDDIKSYARGEVPCQPFIEDSVIQLNLRAFLNPSQQGITELLEVVKVTQKQKEDFKARMTEAREGVLFQAKKLKDLRTNFDNYWARLSDSFAEGLAEHEGVLDECKKRGILGLLEIKSVRLWAGASLSLTYGQTFEGRTPKIGDSRDIMHVILASAADIFVTHDEDFAKVLVRIPIKGFDVVNLRGLLEPVQ